MRERVPSGGSTHPSHSPRNRCARPLAFLAPLWIATACLPGLDGGGKNAPDPPAPLAVRGSLLPLFELLPPGEFARLGAVETSFTSPDTHSSVEARLDALALRIGEDNGSAPPDLLGAARGRARSMPFRGNPSDLLRVPRPDGDLLLVPLGGDLGAPGDEIAVVESEPALAVRAHVRVGVRPQRLALHPAGPIFVCNQYSSYLSILAPSASGLLMGPDGSPTEIPTDFFCSDLLFVPRDPARPDSDRQYLYVANRWRRSVLKYAVNVVRDASGALVDVAVVGDAAPRPVAEITAVGTTPSRLSRNRAGTRVFVTNHRGGAVARIDVATDRVDARFDAGAPSIDLVWLEAGVFVPTLMPDRGLLARDEPARSALVEAAPFTVTGLDGATHEAHPGALFDGTRSYNFEDVRNGLFELDAELRPRTYYTDAVSAEPNFDADQKLLAGALPQALVAGPAGDRLYLALGGSDIVQELLVGAPGSPLQSGRTFSTAVRPFALAVDAERLHVASWGGEVLESFDLASGARVASVDLGYAEPRYPATSVELGERHFYDARWSNNGSKTCAHCHFDELISDGVGFANGAAAPTALHRVKPNHDLMTTDSYFWNGAFDDGSYRSLAFAAQTRTNCEVVLFGLVEGPSSDPRTRIGDPANRFHDPLDVQCRPLEAPQGELPTGFDTEIVPVIAAEQALAAAHILTTTGLDPDALSDAIDLYSAAELRLPPNPHAQQRATGRLPEDVETDLLAGEQLFARAGCAGCHDPDDARHPFTNGGDQGSGADWTARFADTYADDPRVLAALPGGLPEKFLSAIRTDAPRADVNVHLDPIDAFTPFCFTANSCLAFEDPLEPGIAPEEEERRLERLLRFNLADPKRGFVPGNVLGQVKVNVPSLRGVWTQANLLHHGLASSLREAILAPGHPALRAGERGFAVDGRGRLDSHGVTTALTSQEVRQLALYVGSIQ